MQGIARHESSSPSLPPIRRFVDLASMHHFARQREFQPFPSSSFFLSRAILHARLYPSVIFPLPSPSLIFLSHCSRLNYRLATLGNSAWPVSPSPVRTKYSSTRRKKEKEEEEGTDSLKSRLCETPLCAPWSVDPLWAVVPPPPLLGPPFRPVLGLFRRQRALGAIAEAEAEAEAPQAEKGKPLSGCTAAAPPAPLGQARPPEPQQKCKRSLTASTA